MNGTIMIVLNLINGSKRGIMEQPKIMMDVGSSFTLQEDSSPSPPPPFSSSIYFSSYSYFN